MLEVESSRRLRARGPKGTSHHEEASRAGDPTGCECGGGLGEKPTQDELEHPGDPDAGLGAEGKEEHRLGGARGKWSWKPQERPTQEEAPGPEEAHGKTLTEPRQR